MYNILIRPLKAEDARTSYQWRNDSEIWRFTGSKPDIIVTPEIEEEWINKVLSEETSERFAILCDGKYVGNIQLTNITNKEAEFHIFIGDKNYWNKGIASLATYEILHFAKYTLKLDYVYLNVKSNNLSAIKAYTKNNFISLQNKDSDDYLKMVCYLETLKPARVSVFMMVYNHARYLENSLNGIINQKCNFDFEIVVGEDFSTDSSREILNNYNRKFPGKFKLLLHDQNIGAHKNQEIVFKNCLGKYISICEGDDYWTDPYKLQKQVDFLENNTDYSICFHNVEEVDIGGKSRENNIIKAETSEKTYTIEDLSQGNFIHTPSVVFRKNFEKLPDWFLYSPIGDYPLHMLNAAYGKIKYFPEKMAAYRVGIGTWSSRTAIDRIISTMFSVNLLINHFSNREDIIKSLENFRNKLKDDIEDTVTYNLNNEKIAYSLPLKKLIRIVLRKIRYSFK